MKKIEHQIFLETNKLDKKLLLQPIQEKIEIFNRMYTLLDTVSDCDKGDLLAQLEALDLEILEDFDDEYQDKLQYNEIKEVLEDKSIVLEKVKEEPFKDIKKVVKKPEPVTDESILDELVRIGRTKNIGRSTFKDLGIKTSLGWNTMIGKHRIIRTGVFRYRYNIN